MRSLLVSSVRRGRSSIGLQNLCDHTRVCRVARDTYCGSFGHCYNYELTERAHATLLSVIERAGSPRARGAHNQATG